MEEWKFCCANFSYSEILATIACFFSVFSVVYGIYCQRKTDKKIEDQIKIIDEFKSTYQNKIEEEQREREERNKSMAEGIRRARKETEDNLKNEYNRFNI